MSWIGVNDFLSPAFNLHGLGHAPRVHSTREVSLANTLLSRGSLVLELRASGDQKESRALINFEDQIGWKRALNITLAPGGALSIRVEQGENRSDIRLSMPMPSAEARLRITYSWDAPNRRGLLSVEDLDNAVLKQTEFDNPAPLPATDIARLSTDRTRRYFDPSVDLCAVSDVIEPVGLMPGIGAGTMIATDLGARRIERLRRGDMVATAAGAYAPIRWIITRDVPMAGQFAPITLRAPYFGLEHDITVAQDHRMMISGVEAEYLFGESDVLVEARHLLASKGARLNSGRMPTRYHHILLDTHECINMGGAWGESLFVGGLASAPELAATTPIGAMPPSAIPRHHAVVRPALRDYETATLLSALSA